MMKAPLWRAVAWIERAQDADQSNGVPAVYRPLLGWSAPYPETTGYIIPTFLGLARLLNRQVLASRAVRMGEWLLSIQMEDGAFPAGVWIRGKSQNRSIFNSGQILFGLVALWKTTQEERWHSAGLRCAEWLISVQDADGAWRRYTYRNALHVYKTRVAWALALAGRHWGRPDISERASRNLDSALDFQRPNGWFANAGFSAGSVPVLHTFAYTVQGMLEGGLVLGRPECVNSAVRSSIALADIQGSDGSLPGAVTESYSPVSFRCLTGIAQQAIVWARLKQIGNTDRDWLQHSGAALSYLEAVQARSPGHPNDGAFAGSRPLWGPYMRFRYPNWAVKFYLDAVIAHAQMMDDEAWG